MKSRSFFPLWLLIFLGARGLSAVVVYNTLDSSGHYTTGVGDAIYGSNSYQAIADRFLPSGGGLLDYIDLALGYADSPAQVDVRIALGVLDVNGNTVPSSSSLVSGTLDVTSASLSGGALVRFVPSTPFMLTAGDSYWLVVQPHSATTKVAFFDNNIGKTGGVEYTDNAGATWKITDPLTPQNAFIVTVPEPRAIALSGIGVGLWGLVRGSSRRKNHDGEPSLIRFVLIRVIRGLLTMFCSARP